MIVLDNFFIWFRSVVWIWCLKFFYELVEKKYKRVIGKIRNWIDNFVLCINMVYFFDYENFFIWEYYVLLFFLFY